MKRVQQRDLVRRGYDEISRAYRNDEGCSSPAGAGDVKPYQAWIEELALLLRPGARVLDLGCGAGVPGTQLLVHAGLDVLGLDFSPLQIERARQLVPGAAFVEADMATWDSEAASFDAIVSFYALIHLPLMDQQELLPRVRHWLRPGGFFLAIVGHGRWTGVEDFFGTRMFWDHADAATYVEWFRQADLHPLWDRFIPEGQGGHVLVLAQAGGRSED
ncbi:MAG: methyltransferase domain-containing protein [Candidatus Dormibacteraeota bacterium]|nr:methyltransferase domain-containing protein [Candidatus Dormibacteraeota bacterium]